jgi:hypothetical protein
VAALLDASAHWPPAAHEIANMVTFSRRSRRKNTRRASG